MNHVLLGAALPLVAFVVVYVVRGRRASVRMLVIAPLVAAVSGAWAVVPDFPRLWGDTRMLIDWHHRPWCNACWGHCWIDRGEVDRAWYPLVFVAVGAAIILIAWRELARAERGGG